MTPEEEAAFKALQDKIKSMETKLDSKPSIDPDVIAKLDGMNKIITQMEQSKAEEAKLKLDSKRKEFSQLANISIEKLADWTDAELDKSITLEKERKKLDSTQFPDADDALVPKFDSAGKEIPWQYRVNWKKADYPAWK